MEQGVKVNVTVFEKALSSGFAFDIDVATICHDIEEAEGWIIGALFVIKVKLKQHEHPWLDVLLLNYTVWHLSLCAIN